MSMTKQQKLGACFGGAFVLCALALGWFLYSAYAEHQAALDGDEEEGTEGLTSAKQKYGNFYSQSNPFPSNAAIDLVKSNETAYAAWKVGAIELAARGDCPKPPEGLSGTVFKNHLFEQVTRMQKLPGAVAGRICAPTFLFGFDQYLGEAGGTPDQKDLPKLYAQLATITNVVDLFAQSGVLEVRTFTRLEAKDENEEDGDRGGRRNRGKKNKSANGEDAAKGPKCYDYRLEYTVRASAFVKVLNGLAKSPRFYVVSEFGFEHEGESLKTRLDRVGSAAASGGASSRSRRNRERNKKEEEVETGFVTNPETDPPILVRMKLSVYDFAEMAKAAPTSSNKEGK